MAGPIANKRDGVRDCNDGYYLCGDTTPECVAVGTPCSDSRPREGPTLCATVPVTSPVYNDDGVIIAKTAVIDSICTCVQDGMLTTATYANLINVLQTNPIALRKQYQICEGFESEETCVGVLTPGFVAAAYTEVRFRIHKTLNA
ncbi:hypothetical protein QFC19_006198 [Naganishia cerealis]|uniref:Uncharacterized protein n=2 Tax=Naganishia cerealis TaxID=610337 RepID=A0ACC2VH87_9TREE|nr:hypothetical protein QFC19_006292 [Naganishia cerealis]KAJ9098974.1 hypothetical protein QFC19_006198 [Naganishia cerealis]